MELSSLVLLVFLALLIGWIGVILVATWHQVRDERHRASEAARK